jgi:hypothetical protein
MKEVAEARSVLRTNGSGSGNPKTYGSKSGSAKLVKIFATSNLSHIFSLSKIYSLKKPDRKAKKLIKCGLMAEETYQQKIGTTTSKCSGSGSGRICIILAN